MGKLKTNRSAARRFAVTAGGKVTHKAAYLRHLLSSKGRTRKRRLGRKKTLGKADAAAMKLLLPYLK